MPDATVTFDAKNYSRDIGLLIDLVRKQRGKELGKPFEIQVNAPKNGTSVIVFMQKGNLYLTGLKTSAYYLYFEEADTTVSKINPGRGIVVVNLKQLSTNYSVTVNWNAKLTLDSLSESVKNLAAYDHRIGFTPSLREDFAHLAMAIAEAARFKSIRKVMDQIISRPAQGSLSLADIKERLNSWDTKKDIENDLALTKNHY